MMNFRDYYLWAGMILLRLSLYYCSLLLTAPQFLSRGQWRKNLSKPVFRATIQTVKKQKNASLLRRRTCRRQKFLTTVSATEWCGVYGDSTFKE